MTGVEQDSESELERRMQNKGGREGDGGIGKREREGGMEREGEHFISISFDVYMYMYMDIHVW